MKAWLKRLPVVGTVIRMQERYVDDAADALAASIGFFGFLSLFPLLALALAVTGQVFGNSVIEQQRLVGLVTDSVPGLSALAGGEGQVRMTIDYIANNERTLYSFGAVGLVLAAMRIASGAQQASAIVFRRERPTGLGARVEQVRAIVVVGTFALAGAAVSGSIGVDIGSGVEGLAASLGRTALAVALDFALFMLAYRLFTPGHGPAWRTLVPGSLLGAAGWVALKIFGASYITGQATSASNNYGTLGSVIALLLLFYLAGRLYLYGAELAALLGQVDQVPSSEGMAEAVVRVPQVSPRPRDDVPPEPSDAAKLAASGVVLGVAVAVLDKLLGD